MSTGIEQPACGRSCRDAQNWKIQRKVHRVSIGPDYRKYSAFRANSAPARPIESITLRDNGAATTEQFKHLAAAGAGPLAGLGALPGLRVLRPELARIADGTDPLKLQQMFASAMLAADPVISGVYYVDDHFVPYTGAKPVPRAGTTSAAGQKEAARTPT